MNMATKATKRRTTSARRKTTTRKVAPKQAESKVSETKITEVKTITKVVKPSMDDIILGATPEEKEVTIYDVFARNTFFEVENCEQHTKNLVSGKIVETLFGTDSRAEKEQLQEGADVVTIYDRYHQKAKFIIRKV